MSEREGGWEFIAGFLIGAIAGGVAALLLAPQSGEDTRKLLQQKGIEIKDRAVDLTAQARQQAEHLQEQGRVALEEQKSKLQQAVEEGKAAATKKRGELLGKLKGEGTEA